jgi:protein SCO1/2
MNKVIYAISVLISISAGVVGFHFYNENKELPIPESALYYQQPRLIAPFVLIDELGLDFSNSELEDKWSFVFFGYTSCPDVCPITLQNLNFVYDDITTIASNSQVLLVSVDPKRDTVDKLAQYIGYFNSNFKALRAEHDVLFPFSRSLGLMYAITSKDDVGSNENEDENYWVDHSSSLVLINPRGEIAAIFKPEQVVGELPSIDSKKLVSDYRKVVALFES